MPAIRSATGQTCSPTCAPIRQGLTIGHPGNGSTNHLALLQLQKALDVKFNIIPYKSNGLALNDLLAGQIDAVIDQVPASIGHIRGGRLRVIVVTTARRAGQLTDVPTLQESGVKDFASTTPIVLNGTGRNAAGHCEEAERHGGERAGRSGRERSSTIWVPRRSRSPHRQLTIFLQKEDAAIEELQKSGLLKPE